MSINIPILRMPPLLADLSALAAGALLPLAFAPANLYPLAVFLMAVLFASWLRASPRRAFWRGWLFGVGMFGAGVYWVYFSMHVFGHMPPPVAGLFTGLFSVLLALFPALAGLVAVRWFSGGAVFRLLVVFPAVWTLVEWVRGWFLTGFPWLDLGYSQVGSALAGLAPLTGVYGISWAVALSAGLLLTVVLVPGRVRYGALAGVVLLWAGSWAVGVVHWTVPAGGTLKVSLVQGNTQQATKWYPRERRGILAAYAAATRAHWNSDLVIWPETAVPAFYDTVADTYLRELEQEARAHHTALLIGLPVRDPVSHRYYNGMVSLGGQRQFYFKRHLVPFGEYIPLQSVLRNLLDLLHVPMSDFSSGARDQPLLRVAGQPVGVAICYEIAFGEEVAADLPKAAFLVNASNNAWFGHSSASHQVLEMARMRARETGRYVLSATNDGMTAIIDNRGRIVKTAPPFKATVLTGTVQPRRGATPYVRLGNYPVLVFMILLLGFAAVSRIRGKAQPRQA